MTECLIEAGEPCKNCRRYAEADRIMANAIAMVLGNPPGSGLHVIGKKRWKNIKSRCTEG